MAIARPILQDNAVSKRKEITLDAKTRFKLSPPHRQPKATMQTALTTGLLSVEHKAMIGRPWGGGKRERAKGGGGGAE